MDLSSLYHWRAAQYVMDFGSVLLRNTRLVAVLRGLFALPVSVDVVCCRHAGESCLASTGTGCRLWDRGGGDTRGIRMEGGLQLVGVFTALTLQLLSIWSVFGVVFVFVAFWGGGFESGWHGLNFCCVGLPCRAAVVDFFVGCAQVQNGGLPSGVGSIGWTGV